MRPKDRIPRILENLEEYWKEHPDLRLGQILSNFSREIRNDSDPYYMEDWEFENLLSEKIEKGEV